MYLCLYLLRPAAALLSGGGIYLLWGPSRDRAHKNCKLRYNKAVYVIFIMRRPGDGDGSFDHQSLSCRVAISA